MDTDCGEEIPSEEREDRNMEKRFGVIFLRLNFRCRLCGFPSPLTPMLLSVSVVVMDEL